MRVYTLIMLVILALSAKAQEGYQPFYGLLNEENGYFYYGSDADTTQSILTLGARGDVISGYNLVPVAPDGQSLENCTRFYLYQGDEKKRPLKQIVLTTEKWTNVPEWYPEVLGYKFAAVNDNEYKVLKSLGKIKGELFQIRSVGDVLESKKSQEILVFPEGYETAHDSTGYELVWWADKQEIYYLSVGVNACIGFADYTNWMTDGRYNCRVFLFDNASEKTKEWKERTKRKLNGKDPGAPGKQPTREDPLIMTPEPRIPNVLKPNEI